jgi:hypothetical protein
MPSNVVELRDGAPVRGMNTCDDPLSLKEGECVQLTNAMPGAPPSMRSGSSGYLLTASTNWRPIPPIVAFDTGAKTVLLFWVYDSSVPNYKLIAVDETSTSGSTTLGYGTFAATPHFSALMIHNSVYWACSSSLTAWNGATSALQMKVVESNGSTIRDVIVAQAASINALTQAAGSSGWTTADWFEYAFTYIRRTDSAAFEAGTTPTGMILPPGITGIPKRIDTYLPGSMENIEIVANRKTANIAVNGHIISADISNVHTIAMRQGATHLRVYRSAKQSSEALAKAASKYWVTDLPLAIATTSFSDTLTDASMIALGVTLTSSGYTNPVPCQYIEHSKGRVFTFGNPLKPGIGYYSETVGGDGGCSLSDALAYPQKFKSWFNPVTKIIDCHESDSQNDMGMAIIGDDVYFFRERKTFALFGGDPTASTPTLISNIGCAFPHTITKCDVKGYFGPCVLFLSNEGPAVITQGGRIRTFSEFKIGQLWPHHKTLGSELYGELDTHYDWIINNCTAMFWRNSWTIFYTTYAGTFRWFNFYFDPALEYDSSSPRGAWQGEFATM